MSRVVIAGGGFAGLNAAKVLARDVKSIDATSARVFLIEAGTRILPSFSISRSSRIRPARRCRAPRPN